MRKLVHKLGLKEVYFVLSRPRRLHIHVVRLDPGSFDLQEQDGQEFNNLSGKYLRDLTLFSCIMAF